ncbi:polyprenyl synthetase family protein [Fredinandcohnia sp. 179-A 10B2 NHS]|uniref:polyprenyl synthetase family protein n=1 Tax=Fredinandcohnia sp. 179-A 10B2 NHS TaxID=3235176 RepID=UPI0039A25B4A
MNVGSNMNVDTCYRLAEEKAENYFKTLHKQVLEKNYVNVLMKDFQSWKHNHIHNYSILSNLSRKKQPDYKDYHRYIDWLEITGKLDNYLNRSISYIFMRDLGKHLESTETQVRIREIIENLKTQLTASSEEKTEIYSVPGLYRWAQKEGIESSFIWLMSKLKKVSENIPDGMDSTHAQRKLIKIIAGVLMHAIEEMGQEISQVDRTNRLDEAIRLGYCYGLTYPFIDDLLDSTVLNENEKREYSNLIRTTLIHRSVPQLEWAGSNEELMVFIHAELQEAFEYIKSKQQHNQIETFFDQSYVFFHSQEVDRIKDLTNPSYTNEELYIPVILKSSSSRLIARSVIGAPEDEGFDNRTFFYGIYNQLADDFADMFDDLQDGAVTPYTYYIKYHNKRSDLINPFELYWAVISNLIHNVYNSDQNACEVILDRAINGLKRCQERIGKTKYKEVMQLFASGNPAFNQVIQKMVRKADDVDFFDKLLRDQIITTLKNEREEQETFMNLVKSVRSEINEILPIPEKEVFPLLKEQIVDAANYSLESDGKRLRPIITYVLGVNEYGLSKAALLPLIKSLEYMHTASLIFDDLPSQDNALTRRGYPTLHHVYNTAIAELTGLFLTQRAIEEQTLLDEFDTKSVLSLIQYSARVVGEMCRGQAMDLNTQGERLSLEQLNMMCFYKTGIAFEASLVMPAILAQAKESEIISLKKFAKHAGIAFQIKDDLLDVEGESTILGKSVGKDMENNRSTFVTILGEEEAKKAMWDHYCLATETLKEVPNKTSFFKHLLNYMVNRDS